MVCQKLSHQTVLGRHHKHGMSQTRHSGKGFKGVQHHGNASQGRVLLGDVNACSAARASAGDDHMEAGMLWAHGWRLIMGSF